VAAWGSLPQCMTTRMQFSSAMRGQVAHKPPLHIPDGSSFDCDVGACGGECRTYVYCQ
jgi:hypothetical protein